MSVTPSMAQHYLASQLEHLMALPLNSEADIAPWLSESDKVAQALEEQFPVFKPLDIFMHYMHDPDIRVRDRSYRNAQHRLIFDYIRQLRGPIQESLARCRASPVRKECVFDT